MHPESIFSNGCRQAATYLTTQGHELDVPYSLEKLVIQIFVREKYLFNCILILTNFLSHEFPPFDSNIRHVRQEAIQFTICHKMDVWDRSMRSQRRRFLPVVVFLSYAHRCSQSKRWVPFVFLLSSLTKVFSALKSCPDCN